MALPADVEPGIGAEKAAHTAAATWGLPDFVFPSSLRCKGSGQRELGDRLLLSGKRGAVIQIESRTVKRPGSTSTEASFGRYVMLCHHQVGERTGRPDQLAGVGVMPTPHHSGNRPWDTRPVGILGPSHLTSEQVGELEEPWPQNGNA